MPPPLTRTVGAAGIDWGVLPRRAADHSASAAFGIYFVRKLHRQRLLPWARLIKERRRDTLWTGWLGLWAHRRFLFRIFAVTLITFTILCNQIPRSCPRAVYWGNENDARCRLFITLLARPLSIWLGSGMLSAPHWGHWLSAFLCHRGFPLYKRGNISGGRSARNRTSSNVQF